MRYFLMTLVLLSVTACWNSSGGYGNSVWDSYDYRHPVPYEGGAGADANYGYIDNDSYYTPMDSFGCNPDNIHMCE